MLELMKKGCLKAFGDLFQEILGNAAQIPVYRGNLPLYYTININKKIKFPDFYNSDNSLFDPKIGYSKTNNGINRAIIQAGTDRPSSIGRSVIISLFGNENEVNNYILTGYNSEHKYIYVLPRKNILTTNIMSKKNTKKQRIGGNARKSIKKCSRV